MDPRIEKESPVLRKSFGIITSTSILVSFPFVVAKRSDKSHSAENGNSDL